MQIRFYTDDTLPLNFTQQLNTPTSEVRVVDSNLSVRAKGGIVGMFWRFLPMSDPTVDRLAVRDVDSLPGTRERAAMDEWILSGRKWHVFRDHTAHSYWPIMGGMFGAAKSSGAESVLPYDAVEGLIRSGQVDLQMQRRGGDQDFLRDHVWPLIDHQHGLISHDSYHCMEYPSTKAWPTQRLGPKHYVGAGVDVSTAFKFMNENFTEPFPGKTYGQGACPIECRPPHHLDWTFC